MSKTYSLLCALGLCLILVGVSAAQTPYTTTLYTTDGSLSDTLVMGTAVGATYCLTTADSLLGETELPPQEPSDVYDARFLDLDGFTCKGQGSAYDLRPLAAGYYASQTYKLHLHAGGNGTHGDSVVVSWVDSLGAHNGGYWYLVDYASGGTATPANGGVNLNLGTVAAHSGVRSVTLKSQDYLIYTGDGTTYLSFDYSRLTIADHNLKPKAQTVNKPSGTKKLLNGTTPNIFNLGTFAFAATKGNHFYVGNSSSPASVYVKAWSTVTKSSLNKLTTWTATSAGAPYTSRCLDSTSIPKVGKQMKYVKKQLTSLIPGKDQIDNWLFAQLLTLHSTLEMYATGIITPGDFGNLVLASGPDSGMTISALATAADNMISCENLTASPSGHYVQADSATFTEMANQLLVVNDAFTYGGYGSADTAALTGTDLVAWNAGKGKTVTVGGNVAVAAQSVVYRPAGGFSAPHVGKSMIESASKPEHFTLDQNYPNPFNPTTEIRFSLSTPANVTLKVYNILGQVVTTLANNEQFGASEQTVTFNANNYASGTYFYTLRVNNLKTGALMFTDVKKMVLIK